MWMSKSGLIFQYGTSFVPVKMVGLIGLEPMTPALSRRCSNQLSYRPVIGLLIEDC
jgi:hypothetical protein